MAKKYKKISMLTCHYHWISSGTVLINQCISGCYFHVSEHLRSCTELQILKLGGSSIYNLAECPNSRKRSVIDPQCNNAGQVGLGRSCALPKFTWPVQKNVGSVGEQDLKHMEPEVVWSLSRV